MRKKTVTIVLVLIALCVLYMLLLIGLYSNNIRIYVNTYSDKASDRDFLISAVTQTACFIIGDLFVLVCLVFCGILLFKTKENHINDKTMEIKARYLLLKERQQTKKQEKTKKLKEKYEKKLNELESND